MHSMWRKPSLGLLVMSSVLAVACADGDNGSAGSFGMTNLTYTSVPPATTVPMDTTSETDSGDPLTTGGPGGDPNAEETTDDPPDTSNPDPSTTNPDPSTTNPDPSTTNPDPSTTNPDPSTTNPDPSTTNPMTTDPPNPDQPNGGKLYAECLDPEDCVAPNACLTVTDNMTMMVYDGYCTRICNNVNDCGVAPPAPAVQKCVPFDVGVNLCMLECFDTTDCPNGMECTAVTNPNMTMGNYCI